MAGCSSSGDEKNGCVRWVEKYFKDCICNLSSEISFGLGLLSIFCWGIAEIPQIITNFQTKSGHGVSLGFLFTWVIAHILNLVGCLLEPATLPTQLYTALMYTATTVVLLVQTIYYDYFGWWNNRGFQAPHHVDEEKKPLNPKKDDPARPIPTTASTAASTRIDVYYYTSARPLANCDSSPYSGGSSYLRTAKSDPSDVGAVMHESSSGDEDENKGYCSSTNTKTKRIASRSVGYGTFIVGSVGLPFQANALMEMHTAFYGKNMLQEFESNPYGILLGWIMAAIYMGSRLPQIYLNIKRGNVEGLNPLMFIFALIANAAYVGRSSFWLSYINKVPCARTHTHDNLALFLPLLYKYFLHSILVRSVEWNRIKANAPWLLDSIICVLLDLFIIIQSAYYKHG